MASLTDTLNSAGISAFGLSMPILSPQWTAAGATITKDDNNLSLSIGSGTTWLAPLPGTLRQITNAKPLGVTLVRANGSLLSGNGALLTIFAQPYLRLARLYAQELETSNANRPERDRGLPYRPVPRYFFYANAGSGSDGEVKAGDDTGCTGELTVYDENGLPIDPIAVAAALRAILQKRQVLASTPPGANPLDAVAGAAFAGTAVVRIRLADPAGKPFDNSANHVTGITTVSAAQGLYTLNAAGGGGGSALSGTVGLQAGSGASGAFPDEARRLIAFGPATTGRLGQSFSPPQLPAGVALTRDFFSLRLVELGKFLLGDRPAAAAFQAMQYEKPPAIRINEPLNLLLDGNDVLAAANMALSGSPGEALCVAQAIDGGFDVPTATGANAHWPAFPPPSGSPSTAPLAVDLKKNFNPAAAFNTGSQVDVVLTLHGLPAGAAVRVYPRKFVEDAREARGDGAGGIVSGSGDLTLLLKDPLGLKQPDGTVTTISQPTLRCDVMVVERNGTARLYGNVSATVGASASAPGPGGTNPFGTAARRSVCNAGVLGLAGAQGALPTDPLQLVLALAGEGTPRDPPRFPTMARRELLVAGNAGGHWTAVIAGGRLTPEAHSADARRGAPGGRGGRETQIAGVSTQNGRLAYDLARMAFRRTTNIVSRLTALATGSWDEPPELSAPALGSPATANSGTFAGAVLQTISSGCETPELAVLQSSLGSLPQTFSALVDWVKNNLVPGGLPLRQQLLDKLNELKSNARGTLLFNELQREVVASCYGRRDAQWALASAIDRARHFIYIESPGFAATKKDYGGDPTPGYAVDLIQRITTRMNQASGLRVMICTPKYPDYAPGYEPFAAREVAERRTLINGLPTASDPTATRVAAFHPIGFPGRYSRLESTVVIIDDVWALVGSSTVRRRGLTFDGGSDLVFTDFDVVEGRSPAIAEFRRQLMANRLGVDTSTAAGALPDPGFVRLRDGVEAFHVVRERLVAGGLGKIDLLWNGRTPGVTYPDPNSVSFDLVNPDGQEFTSHLPEALLLSVLANLHLA